MVKTAYDVGLTPFEFWGRPDDLSTGMTIKEFSDYVESHRRKFEIQMEQLAWVCANIMNCWVKKAIKPEKLLPKTAKRKPGREKFTSSQDAIAHLSMVRDEAETRNSATINLVDDGDVDIFRDEPLELETFEE
jgi:hypothetical protein